VEAAVVWRTGQSGAPATSPGRWVPTVGALTCGPAWLSGGAPDRPYRLSAVPPTRALLLCARRRAFNALQSTVARELVVAPLLHRTVRSAADSPVNYSGAPLRIPEGVEFSLEFPGAPDQGALRLSLALFV
jgi:hypothetical protein